MAKYLAEFASGPLDRYRKIASFDWKKMKIFIESEDFIEYQHRLISVLKKEPLFQQNVNSLSWQELRKLSIKRMFFLRNCELLNPGEVFGNKNYPIALSHILFNVDPSTSIKLSIAYGMFPGVIQGMGTKRHFKFLEQLLAGEIVGSYCLTEIGHGTNAKGMRTTATYNKDTKQFILHSPDFESAKCWAGSLGQTATHSIVFSNLITSDGVEQGLHPFIVPIRDPNTLLPYPGVIVGDMGQKVGLNGIDNGFIMFNEYCIPKDYLLNKIGDVDDNGNYVTPYTDPNKRHGASFGALSIGRVNITNICAVYAIKGISIAIRYAGVRKQFGQEGQDEMPILEYQSHQYRLIPYLAATYALKIFAEYLVIIQNDFQKNQIMGENKNLLPDLGLELHGVSSAAKPIASWTSRDILQECREACAGHGYLKQSGIGDLRNDNDANCTYEGENHVLIQQTSNWLLKFWPNVLNGEPVSSPMNSVDFITNAKEILKTKFNGRNILDVENPENVLHMHKWLTCYLLKESYEKLQSNLKSGMDPFTARNENQVFYAKSLAIAYIRHFILQVMYNKINETNEANMRNPLLKLLALYGLFTAEKDLTLFYRGGYLEGNKSAQLIQDTILKLIKDLKDDAVALVDVIAPNDFVMNSVLGKSDGQVYKHLQASFYSDPNCMSRPDWWQEVTTTLKAKL